MKYLLPIFVFLACMNIYAKDYIYTLGDKVPNTKYVDSMAVLDDYDHADSAYKLTDTDTVTADTGDWYEVKSYMFVDDEYDYMKDTTFCRLDFVCHTKKDGKDVVKTHKFINDNRWLRFNHFGFGVFSKFWEDNTDIMFRKIDMADGTMALTFRGFRDSCGLPELAIFILRGSDVMLVYNKEVDISEMKEKKGKTTYIIYDNWFEDHENPLIPHFVKIVFGKKSITIE